MGSGELRALVLGTLLCASTSSLADKETEDEELPDLEFLEYLGLWEDADDEWLLLDEEEVTDNDERRDPVPDAKESTETDDES